MKREVAQFIVFFITFAFLTIAVFSYLALGLSRNGEIVVNIQQLHTP